MSLVEQTDQVQQALDLLITQYKDKPNLEAYLSSFVTQIQEAEAVAFDIFAILDIDSQNGEQLDLLGRIVGQLREGRSDADYRLWIKARIAVNKGSGTGNQLLELIELLADSGTTRFIDDFYPAGFELHIEGEQDSARAEAIASILQEARGAGIYATLHWYEDVNAFEFSSSDTVESVATGGLGDDTLSTGGAFVNAR